MIKKKKKNNSLNIVPLKHKLKYTNLTFMSKKSKLSFHESTKKRQGNPISPKTI